MEKNKNRTDLLAAGRKRLQQFRQKKDSKGNKSSAKPSNSELGSDADLASTAKVAVVLSQVPDQDVSSINDTGASNAGSSVPSYEDNMEATNIDVATSDPLFSPIIPETAMVTATLAHGVDLLPEDQDSMMSLGKEQDSDPLVSHQVESSIVVEGAGSNYSGNLEYVASELDYSTHSATPNYVDSSDMNFFVDTTKPVAVAVEADHIDRADQGADCLALEQVVKDSEVELENDARLGLSAGGESVETAARKYTGETEMVEPTVGVSQSTNKIDVPASASAIDEVEEVLKREGNLVSALPLPQPYGPSIINADIGTPGNSTTDAKSSGCSQSLVPDSHVIERLKEQLYLANCAKDVSLFQLDEQSKLQMEFYQEHQQLFHEVSSASNLVSELRLRNECLCEELVACRSDIQVAVCAKEEIEKQYNAAKAEVVEISMRADELHVELQRSHEALSSQIAEIADSKAFVAALQAEIDTLNGNLTSAVEEKNKVAEEKGFLVLENEKLLTELVECKGSLKSLWVENANLNDILVLASEERKNLEEVKKNIVSENEKLLTDLTECKALLEVLQAENSNLKGNLTLVTEERDKFAEEKDHFAIEREKLSLELAVFKNIMAALQMEHRKALDELKEAHSCLEQPSEGNIKLSLPRDGQIELSPPQLEKPDDIIVDGLPVEQLKLDVCDQFLGLVDFNGHLEEAAKIIQKLEDAIQELHSQSVSSTSSGKMEAPAVSRLIQAFESRVHHDDRDEEEVPSTENIVHIEPILLAKEQTSRLRVVFKELLRNSENAIQLLKGERDRRILADVSLGELKVTYEALKEHSSSCEAASIELDVLYEFIKRHLSNIEAKKGGLMALYDTVRQQSIILEAENNELVQKLGVSQSRIGELERKMDEMILRSDEMVSSVSNQAEDLRKEVAERELKLQQVVQSVRKFYAFVGRSCSTLEIGNDDGLDLGGCVTASVDAATKLIENLQEKLEASRIDHEVMCTSYKEMVENLSDLHAKNELAIGVLHSLHGKLEKLVVGYSGIVENSQIIEENENLIDSLHLDNYDPLIEQLTVLLTERLQLESMNYKLNLELIDRTNDVEKLKKREIDSDTILNLVEEVENAIKLECTGFNSDELESRLHSSMSLLFQKYKEADEQLHFSREKNISFEIESSKLQEQIEGLSFLVAQHENESMILKESLRQGTEDFVAIQAELKEKVNELEQSEQRVSSIREKLSIAVSKGKGLIVQRDNLKQSLAETSNELEKYVQELQVKDSRLQEVETRLKAYSEAGERVEALESELSYIRNSATALRESFLLKDSVLQGIEEILEDLELPENFHSRDIIEKVDWLARSVTGNSLPLTDGDQKSPVGGGSYSDAGFVASDAWKEDMQQNQNTGDDLRKKYEELQSKFYGLAEQNDMLEQSLMERNNVVQRWEEILDRIDMPSQLRSMEPEERIEWLGSALSQAHHHCDYLQQKVDNLETYCATITADLDESQKRLSGIDKALQTAASEKEHLLGDLGSLTRDYDDASKMGVKLEFENDKLQNEISALQEELSEKVKNYDIIQFENDKLQNQVIALQEKFAAKIRDYELIEGEIKRLEDLVSDALQDNVARDVFIGSSGAECLKQLLQKLVEKYTSLSLQKSIVSESVDEHITEEAGAIFNNEKRDSGDTKEKDAAVLKEELEETLRALMSVKEERDRYMEINQSLTCEVETLDLKRQELQELRSQEEQKSASVREKLNVAVRKGKSLLQQRDTLKLTIEEVSNEVERLKSEIKYRESSLLDYEQRIEDLDTNKERIEVLESEALVLGNRLADTEYSLQERTHTLSMILDTLNGIDAGFNNITDPVEKLNQIAKKWHDLHVSMASSDNSLNKSKRSAELLLAELNEVQERNDGLQEELAQAASELSGLSRERDFAEASKHEAISRLEKLSAVHYEERNKQLAELKVAKSCFLQLSESFFDIVDLVSNIFSKDREYLYNLEANMISCLEPSSALDMVGQHTGGPFSAFPANAEYRDKFFATNSLLESKMQERIDDHILAEICGLLGHQLQDFLKEIGVLKEEIYKNSITLDERAKHVSEVAVAVCREVISQKQSFESMKKNLNRLEHIEKEKDTETDLMRRNISLLHEACSSSVMEIENWKAQFVGSNLTAADLQMNLASFTYVDSLSSEEGIRTMADRLLLVVKDFIHFQAKIVEGGLKDMKATIINLQKELQEKDIQKDRICVELVNQIKEAEAAARSHLQDSQSVKARLSDVERCLEVMEEERNLLKQRVKELEDGESKELDERVRSLNGLLVAKEQEIEALMQALDEEETQMEDLTNKISELEQVVQQKNLELENVESSRGKVMKKLSITVCKFDELHHLSASLLSEVEKLQLQVHERDEEISFLRQEVTRCTNDALLASQMNNKRNLNEMHDLVTWLNTVISGVQVDVKQSDDQSWDQVLEYKELLQKQIGAMLSQLEDLRAVVQSKDMLLQVEKTKVEDLMRKGESLENSLREKESQMSRLLASGDSGRMGSTTSEIVEVEPVMNKWPVPGTSIASQVRSLRKVNNDQVAIAIDTESSSRDRLEDEDDDKAHGFKSLTTSKIVPRFTRPVTDMIDGLWVSCDRALMRQPALRLGVIIYWAIIHALLATFAV